MPKVSVFIDGFNVYHAMDSDPAARRYKWLDYHKLASQCLEPDETLFKSKWFTAYVKDDQAKRQATCREQYEVYEEKPTDVQIAVHMLEGAHKEQYDRAILILPTVTTHPRFVL